jgi:hypothetical protein
VGANGQAVARCLSDLWRSGTGSHGSGKDATNNPRGDSTSRAQKAGLSSVRPIAGFDCWRENGSRKVQQRAPRETGIIKHQANPLLARERQDYALALEHAIAGLRVAHQVLAQARQRITGG